MKLWEQLAAWATLVTVATAVVHYWLGASSKAAIREEVTRAWFNVVTTDALTFVKMPLRLFSRALDRIYGTTLLSWKGFWRVSVASTCVLLASLTCFGVLIGKPFGIETFPWTSFEATFQAIEATAQNEQYSKTLKPEERASEKGLLDKLKTYNTSDYKVAYSLTFVVLVLALNCVMYFLCLGIARKVLRDMQQASSFITLFSLHTLNCLISAIVYTSCLSIVCVAAAPIIWAIVGVLLLVFFASKLAGALLTIPAILCVLIFSPGWIRLFAINAALPSILLLGVSVITLVLFPVRVRIQTISAYFLDKLASRDYAVIAFCVAALSGLVAWLTHAL